MDVCNNQEISGDGDALYTNHDASLPLLVEETRAELYPYSLCSILSSIPYSNVGVNEIFASVVYAIAVECGFCLTADNNANNDLQNYYCDVRKLRNIKHLAYDQWGCNSKQFILTLYLGSCESFPCTIYFIPLSDLLLVNAYSITITTCYSAIFNPNNHVKLPSDDYNVSLYHLKYLSDSCKNNLFVPLRAAILVKHSVQNASLVGCNLDILLTIIKYLDKKSIKSLISTCSHLRNVLWHCIN